jgi:hypothetical protein
MNRYDRDWPSGRRGFRGGYDESLTRGPGFWGRGVGLYRQWGTAWEAAPRGPQRGYGRDFGRGERGMYDRGYGAADYGRPPSRGGRGYGQDFGFRGYDRGYAQDPFIPEAAYRRHPEMEHAPRHGMNHRAGQRGFGDTGGGLSDEEIRFSVRESLYQDTWLDADRIEVEVDDGVVTLKGEVDDFLEARYAWDDAWETEGVRGVVNHLTVSVQSEDAAASLVKANPPQNVEGGEGEAGSASAKRPARRSGTESK